MSSFLQEPLLDHRNSTNLESEHDNRPSSSSTVTTTSSFSLSGKALNVAEELTSDIELSRQSSVTRTSVEGLLNGRRISRGVHWLDDSIIGNPMELNASESFSSSSAIVQPDSGKW